MASIHAALIAGQVENEECGVRSVENGSVESVECGKCGVWKVRSVESAECGKCGVWKVRSVENAECGKFGGFNDINNSNKHSIPFKRRCIIAFSLLNRTSFFQAVKNISKKVNKRIKRVKHYCQ